MGILKVNCNKFVKREISLYFYSSGEDFARFSYLFIRLVHNQSKTSARGRTMSMGSIMANFVRPSPAVLTLLNIRCKLVIFVLIQLFQRSVIDFRRMKKKRKSISLSLSLADIFLLNVIIPFSFQSCVICRTRFPILFPILIWCF